MVIRHGKYFTTYGNLETTSVSKGSKVKAGQLVGRAATNSDGNGEIEFLLLLENKNLDPLLYGSRKIRPLLKTLLTGVHTLELKHNVYRDNFLLVHMR